LSISMNFFFFGVSGLKLNLFIILKFLLEFLNLLGRAAFFYSLNFQG
jgi:hypothetical protein